LLRQKNGLTGKIRLAVSSRGQGLGFQVPCFGFRVPPESYSGTSAAPSFCVPNKPVRCPASQSDAPQASQIPNTPVRYPTSQSDTQQASQMPRKPVRYPTRQSDAPQASQIPNTPGRKRRPPPPESYSGTSAAPSFCGRENSNSHGARPVHLIITMIKWIRTSRLSIKNSADIGAVGWILAVSLQLPPFGVVVGSCPYVSFDFPRSRVVVV